VRKEGEKKMKGTIKIEPPKKNAKIPYPPIALENLWRIANFNQIANPNLIKYALTIGKGPETTTAKYKALIHQPEEYEKNPMRCWTLNEELTPGIDFMVKLGINTVRPYTLASWDPACSYIDLVVAVDPLGLTSRYLQSRPSFIKIKPTTSSFYIPSGRPMVMVANGVGIAPFRSLVPYFLSPGSERPSLHLYLSPHLDTLGSKTKTPTTTSMTNGRPSRRRASSN
jgi:hypothetical protein